MDGIGPGLTQEPGPDPVSGGACCRAVSEAWRHGMSDAWRPLRVSDAWRYCAESPPFRSVGSRSNSPSRAPSTNARHSASV